MKYLGQRTQIDVKFVSSVYLIGDTKGKKFINIQQYINTADIAI